MFMLFARSHLTTLAGLSTGLGGLVVLLFKRPRARMMARFHGVLPGRDAYGDKLSDMLPHTVETYSDTVGRFSAGLYQLIAVMGMLIALLLERCIPDERNLRPARTGMRRVGHDRHQSARCATAASNNEPPSCCTICPDVLTLFTSYASNAGRNAPR